MDKAQKVPMMAPLNSKKKDSETDEVREELLDRTYETHKGGVDKVVDIEKVQEDQRVVTIMEFIVVALMNFVG